MKLTRNEKLEQIVLEIIRTTPELEYIKDAARIAVLESDEKKTTGGMATYGRCQKVDNKYKWYMPFDFQIIIYKENTRDFSDRQLKILLEHELSHVGIGYKDGEAVFSIVRHDLEDFRRIVEKYGANWHLAQKEQWV